MSITDGQIIFDLGVFRQGIRPAVNAGLSVSRVGGQAQTGRQKRLSGSLFKKLAKYHQAEEFSHFGSSLSKEASIDLTLGKQIYEVLAQPPEERHSLTQQQLLLETVLLGEGITEIDVKALKESVQKMQDDIKEDADFDRLEKDLLKKHGKPIPGASGPSAPNPADQTAKPAPGQPPANQDQKPPADKSDKPESDANKDDHQKAEEPQPKQEQQPVEKPKEEAHETR